MNLRGVKGASQLKFILCFALSMFFFMSCDTENRRDPLPAGDHSLFIVCEGNYGSRNASLDIIDTFYTDTIHRDVYYRANQTRLGGFAHHMLLVDSFGVITVTQENRIEVFDAVTFKSLQTLQMSSPRHAAYDDGRIFVSCYMDSQIAVILYPQWTLERTVKIMHKPGQIAVMDHKIFIAGSDALFSPGTRPDTVITVMESRNPLNHHTVTAGLTPVDVKTSRSTGFVYIACKGTETAPGYVSVLDPQSEMITGLIGYGESIRPVQIALSDSLLACIKSENGSVRVYSIASGNFIRDISVNAYSVSFCGNQLLVTDARDYLSSGQVIWYDDRFQVKNTYATGIAPAHILCH